jgi:hypothetical protein
MNHLLSVLVLALFVVAPCRAQVAVETDWLTHRPDPAVPQGENLAIPEGWQWRLDRADAEAHLVSGTEPVKTDVRFVNMTPGWHITTGPAVILYHPALSAQGSYRAEAKFHLFPPGERNESFGLFVGGSDLDGEDQSYLYFLIRKTAEFLVKRRDGDSTSVVHEWTAHPAIVPYTSDTEGTATNILAVEAAADSMIFFVNDQKVAAVPRASLPADGLVGLRVNHALNVHVSDLKAFSLE